MTRLQNEKKSRDHTSKMLARIKKAHRHGRVKNADQATREYISSYDAKYLAVVEAADKLEKCGVPRPTKKEIEKITSELDAWSGTNEEVRVILKPKNGDENDWRPIMSFGIENRALQYLVRHVLEARSELQPNQFLTRGGTPVAVKAALEALGSGHDHVAEIDIAQCYSSFDGSTLPGLLPLPKRVTTNVITSSRLNLVPGNLTELLGPDVWSDDPAMQEIAAAHDVAAVRQGIPQGSAVSPLVTEILLAPVIAQLPKKGVVVNYADNVLVMGREANDTVALIKALLSALTSHPAGPLKPSRIDMYPPGKTIEFLGYAIHRGGPKLKVTPTPHNKLKFRRKFKTGREKIEGTPATVKARKREIKRLAKYVRSWTAGFPLWDEAYSHQQKYVDRTKMVAKELGIAVDIK